MATPDLVGKRTTLAPMRLDEADLLVRWVNDPDLQGFWFGGEAKRSEVLERWPPVYFDDAYPQKGRAFRIVDQDAPVGALVYHPVWGRPRNARIELLLAPHVDEEVGADALRALSRYLFDEQHVAHLWGELPPQDLRTVAAFQEAGFARTGRTADEGRIVLHRARPEPQGSRATGTKAK